MDDQGRTALLAELASRWRPVFLEPEWCLDVSWSDASLPHAGAAYVCAELLYARIEAHPSLPDALLERVVVHELAELELYEVGRQVEALASTLPPAQARAVLDGHREARHRVIERRVSRLLPGPRRVPVWTGAGFSPGGPP